MAKDLGVVHLRFKKHGTGKEVSAKETQKLQTRKRRTKRTIKRLWMSLWATWKLIVNIHESNSNKERKI
jgi:hypothetical protein